MTDSYPAATSAGFVERVKSFPPGAKVARWVIRDDNQQHYHGVVSLADSPFLIELRWKPASDGAEQLVGFYRLRLPELLAGDFVRFEREGTAGDSIRLRFYRGAGGVVFVQSRADRPGLAIGSIKLERGES